MGQVATLSASLWYRSSSWRDIKAKASEIFRYIQENMPLAIPTDEGYLWIKTPATIPFAQPVATGSNDEMIKRIVLTIEAESLSRY